MPAHKVIPGTGGAVTVDAFRYAHPGVKVGTGRPGLGGLCGACCSWSSRSRCGTARKRHAPSPIGAGDDNCERPWHDASWHGQAWRCPRTNCRQRFFIRYPCTPCAAAAAPPPQAYFLTHAHSDHYTGLSEAWCAGPVYCSELTARLVAHLTGVSTAWLRPLPLGRPVVVEGGWLWNVEWVLSGGAAALSGGDGHLQGWL